MVEQNNKIQVAVTGMAWTTALGNDLEKVWQHLINGESGIRQRVSPYQLRNDHVASVTSASHSLPAIDHLHNLTDITIRSALNDASINNTSNIHLIVGTSFGARLDDEQQRNHQSLHEWIDVIARPLRLIPIGLSTACSSASDAILIGSTLIKNGYTDICICGGADILGDAKRLAHSALGTMSPTQLRSFDYSRSGTILGEGSGFIVLEKYKPSLNKKIYALLSGCGSANDAAGLTAPDDKGNGIKLAIERSLRDANLQISDISLVNAHASGTITNDKVEAKTYKDIFHTHKPTIFATKGAFGHSLGATGALEAIALIMALRERVVPPIVNLTSPLESEAIHFPMMKAASHAAKFGLSLTIGFGGFNTSLIFERVAKC